jgi:YHS domain-containing protein
MGEGVLASKTVPYGGALIGFCCDKCVATFKKDPKQYVTKVQEEIKGRGPAPAEKAEKKDEKKPAGKGAAAAKPAKPPVNKTCPVDGESADPEFTALQANRTVGFCSEACVAKFKKEPGKYMKKVVDEEKAIKKEQMEAAKAAKSGKKDAAGEPMGDEPAAETGDGATEKAAEKPAVAAKKADAKAAAGKPLNKTCPIDPGGAVDPTVTVAYEGKTIGLCCEDCKKQFALDPAAYAADLK